VTIPIVLAVLLMQIPKPETIWPVSVFAWVTGLTAVFSLFTALRKSNNEPILKDIGNLREEMKAEIQRLKESQKFQMDQHERRVENMMNGLGGRVTDNFADIQRHDQAIGEQAGRLIRSEEDRKQLNNRVGNVESRVEAFSGMVMGMERNIRDHVDQKIDKMTEKLMNSINGHRHPQR
jgi:hypothetical protein